MKAKIKPRQFTSEHLTQAKSIQVEKYFGERKPVCGITIDDVNTVDRDDGIWLVELDDGRFELQISITDISELIPKGSPIDQEALARVVTLYHTQPPTPMLPCRLSTSLGSLDEKQQTLALTVLIILDRQGKVNSFDIQETIFTNQKAFSYEEVEKILQKPRHIPEHNILLKLQKISQLNL